jgi:hypothetical protein
MITLLILTNIGKAIVGAIVGALIMAILLYIKNNWIDNDHSDLIHH